MEKEEGQAWAALRGNPLWEKQVSAETKAILAQAEVQSLPPEAILLLLLAMELQQHRSRGSMHRVHLPAKLDLFLGLPFMTWFTGLTAAFGFLIVGVASLTFAVYIGFSLGQQSLTEPGVKSLHYVPLNRGSLHEH